MNDSQIKEGINIFKDSKYPGSHPTEIKNYAVVQRKKGYSTDQIVRDIQTYGIVVSKYHLRNWQQIYTAVTGESFPCHRFRNPPEVKEYAITQFKSGDKTFQKIANNIQEMYGVRVSEPTLCVWKKQLTDQSKGGDL